MKRNFVLHPFLFAIYPVVALYVKNYGEARLTDTLRPGVISLLLASLLTGLFWIAVRNWHRAGLAASVTVVLFSTFGHAYGTVRELLSQESILQRANLWMAGWSAMLILGVWASLRLTRRPFKFTQPLNITAGLALASCMVLLILPAVSSLRNSSISRKSSDSFITRPGMNWDGKKPDIYYLVLDGFARSDALQAYYGVDNTPFLTTLREKGFVIAERSITNYWRTTQSLASSLNYHYLDDLVEAPVDSIDIRPLSRLIKHSAVRQFLEDQGYRTYAFSTGYYFSEVTDADIYYLSVAPLTEFEYNLLIGSMGIYWVNWAKPTYHRADILNHFQSLADTADDPGPKFVFAHLVIPHPPFVFDQDGEPVQSFGSGDGINYSGGLEKYLSGYAQQVQFTEKMVEDTVDTILANTPEPPIIIIQADHGPGAYFNWLSAKHSCLSERMPILAAYYLPGKDAMQIIPNDITPVNTFRIVFNAYFDGRLPIEENRAYAIYWQKVYDFVDLTGEIPHMIPATDNGPCTVFSQQATQ